MSLEKDIQQREFRNEYQKAILNILYTYNYLQDKMNDVFKNHDITNQQYNVLRILRGQYPGHASVNSIRDRMIYKMSDVSRIVERLRLKGLIDRKSATRDKRAVEVTITESGLKMLEKMEPDVNHFESFLGNLTEEETRLLNGLLDKVRKSADLHAPNPETPFHSEKKLVL